MSVRIPLTVSTLVQQNTNVAKFVLDVKKIRGLVQFRNGLVQVTFQPTPDAPVQVVVVDESFDEIAQAILDADYETLAENASVF